MLTALPSVSARTARGRRAAAVAALTIATSAVPQPARPGDLLVSLAGLRSAEGIVRVAVCPRASFLETSCPYVAEGPATAPTLRVRDLPAGVYAVQAIHDENGNGRLDRGTLGRPLEGMGFSRDAPMRAGPPRFADAAFRLGDDDARTTLTMRYFK